MDSLADFFVRLMLGLILGGVLGSFITMLTYRLPRGKSILTPRSACPSCRKTIAWKNLIPIVSYLTLKGRCANCGKEFSKMYLYIEIATAAIVTLIFLFYGMGEQALMLVIIYAILATLGVIVYRQGKDKPERAGDDD